MLHRAGDPWRSHCSVPPLAGNTWRAGIPDPLPWSALAPAGQRKGSDHQCRSARCCRSRSGMPWASRSTDARDYCLLSRLSPHLCLDLSRVDDVARQVNSPVVDKRQDGGHPRGHAAHLFGLLGWHLSEKGLRQLPEAAGETQGVAEKGCGSKEVDAPACVCEGVTDVGFRHGFYRGDDAVDVLAREAVHESACARRGRAVQCGGICLPSAVVQAVVQRAVDNGVELSVLAGQFGDVGDVEARLDTYLGSTG